MLVVLLYLTQCQRDFHMYVLDNQLVFADEDAREHAEAVFCYNYENGAFVHPHYGRKSAVQNRMLITTSSSSTIVPEESVDDISLTNYRRWAVADPESCDVSMQYTSDDTIATVDGLPEILKLANDPPYQVFLGEYGLLHKAQDQGTCGSCYAFAARLIFQSLMKWNAPYYKKRDGLNYGTTFSTFEPIFKDHSYLLSVQYLLNNTDGYGINMFCGGGLYEQVMQQFLRDQTSTQELNSNFPYEVMLNKEEKLEENATRISPNIPESAYDNPFYWYRNVDGCPTGAFSVEADDFHTGWNDYQIKVIKVLLAHGIPLAGYMHFNGSGVKSHMLAFQNYKDGYVAGNCTQDTTNHQVTLVGYGTYKGVPVWVYYNSWGASWGYHGFYYVKMRTNAMCHETLVTAVLPRYFRYNQADKGKAFVDTQHYKDNRDFFTNTTERLIRRGYNGLDFDDGSYKEEKITWSGAIMIVILILLSLFVLYHLFVSECCPSPLTFKPTIYVLITPYEEQEVDWEKDCALYSS